MHSGEVIASRIPWLYELYTTKFRDYAEVSVGKRLFPSRDVTSAVNINLLEGIGAAYEWHVDSNPVTGLLFVNTLSEQEGGQLLFRTAKYEIAVTPVKGDYLVFDARVTPHCVTPLACNVVRASIPMNFYNDPWHQVRPNDLNNYLYGR